MDYPEDEDDQDWNEPWDKDSAEDPEIRLQKQVMTGLAKEPVNVVHLESSSVSGDSVKATLMSCMKLNDNKAGMQGIDKERINQIIYEASKGSRFYENEKKKEQQVNKRIQEQKQKICQLTEAAIQQGVIIADKLLAELESGRDLSKTIVHVDMDAFFAAVEMRDNPSLRLVPMAVGSNSMLSTSNYLARQYGVRAAMPGFIGKKLCPDLVIVPVSYEKYQAVSKKIRMVLSQYDPNMCPMSLDEAYLDITKHLEKRTSFTREMRTFSRKLTEEELCCCVNKLKVDESITNTKAITGSDDDKSVESELQDHQKSICSLCNKPTVASEEIKTFGISAEEAVKEMRFRIQAETKLTASAGIAPNMLLAKVCSDKNKPNGQYQIQPTKQDVLDFINDLPIRKVCGIGKVSEKMLAAVGVTMCKDLYEKRGLLYHLYSTISFNYFMRVCIGIGSCNVNMDSKRKSIGVERTFNEISRPAELYKKCYELSETLSEDMIKEELWGKNVTLKLKLSNFELRTRSHTQSHYFNDLENIYKAAKELLRLEIQASAPSPLKLRLMGVRMTNLIDQSEVAKQTTISKVFNINKVQPRTQPHVSSSLPEQCRTEVSDATLVSDETINQDQTMQSSGNNSNQDHLPESKQDVDVCQKLCPVNAQMSNSENHTLAFCGKTIKNQNHSDANDTEKSENANNKEPFPHFVSASCVQGTQNTITGMKQHTDIVSPFGWVSHSKVDSEALKTSLFLKEQMNNGTLIWNQQKMQPSFDSVNNDNAHVAEDNTAEGYKDGTTLSEDDSFSSEWNTGDNDATSTSASSGCISLSENKSDLSTHESVEQHNVDCVHTKGNEDGANEDADTYKKYECPICSQNLYFPNLDLFTEHIDECLAIKCVSDGENSIQSSSAFSINASGSTEQRRFENANPELGHEDVGNCVSSDCDNILVCPVCNAPQRKSDSVSFNRHMDVCLNRQAIKEIVQKTEFSAKRKSSDHIHVIDAKKPKTEEGRDKPAKATILDFFKGKIK